MLKQVKFFAGDAEVMQTFLELVLSKAKIILDTRRFALELFGNLRGSKHALIMSVDGD